MILVEQLVQSAYLRCFPGFLGITVLLGDIPRLGVLFLPSPPIALLSLDLPLLRNGELSGFVGWFVADRLILDEVCDLLSVDGLETV